MTPAPRSVEPRRFVRTAAAVCVVALALAFTLGMLDWWNRRALPVFADRPHPTLSLATAYFLDGRSSDLLEISFPHPLFELTNLAIRWWGMGYAGIMRAQWPLILLYVLACAVIGKRIAGPTGLAGAGALAAVAPITPMIVLAMDDHMLMTAPATAAVAALVIGAENRRVFAFAAAGVLAGLTFRYTFVVSNALLAIGCVVSAAAGLGIESLSRARWNPALFVRMSRQRWQAPESVRARRAWIAFAVCLYAAGFGMTPHNFIDFSYYATEAESASRLPVLWRYGAYIDVLVRYLWGPALAAGLVAGLVVMFRLRHPLRWLMLAWPTLEIVALSILAKKNAYYVYYAGAAAAPVAGAGLALIRRRGAAITVLAALILATVGWTAWGMTTTTYLQVGTDHPVFQEMWAHRLRGPASIHLEDGRHPAPRLSRILAARRAPGEPLVVVVLGTRDLMEYLRYFLDRDHPRVRLHNLFISNLPPPEGDEPAVMVPCALVEASGGLAGAARASIDLIEHDDSALPESLVNVRTVAMRLTREAADYELIDRFTEQCVYDRIRTP